jgi:hypothetical protein
MSRLERVWTVGCAEILRNELLLWYGQSKISIGMWRDIAQKWAEVLEAVEEDYTPESQILLVGESDSGYVLVWGEGLTLTSSSEDAWFHDIQELATRKVSDKEVEWE